MPAHGPHFCRPPALRSSFATACCLLGMVGCTTGNLPWNGQIATRHANPTGMQVDSAALELDLVRFDDAPNVPQPGHPPSGTDDQPPVESDQASESNKQASYTEPTTSEVRNAAPVIVTDQLDSLIATALALHPSIAAARQRVAAAAYRIPQAKALPDPMLGNTFWPIQDQALQTAGGRVGHQFALSQTVPWPQKLGAKSAVAMREVQVAQAEIRRIEREIVESVRLAYYELWLADELIRIVEDNKKLVSDLITISEARYETGGSQQDVLRAELEADKLEDQLIDLRNQKEQARADLGTLVRQPVDMMPTAFGELDIEAAIPQLDPLIASAERCNPTLQGLAAEIARDRARETLACAQKYPDLQFGVGYAIIDDNTNAISPVANGHDNINFTLGVTLPIWHEKNNAGVREAAHTRSSTMNRREAEQDRIRGQLRRQVAAADAAIQRRTLFRERLVPRTERTLEIAIADYQGRKSDFTNLIDLYQELLAYQVQVARTEAALAGALAQIERTVGCEGLTSFSN